MLSLSFCLFFKMLDCSLNKPISQGYGKRIKFREGEVRSHHHHIDLFIYAVNIFTRQTKKSLPRRAHLLRFRENNSHIHVCMLDLDLA